MLTSEIAWVPIDQALPDDETNVLFTDGENLWCGHREAGGWFADYTAVEIRGITHWADIPELPQSNSK